ncbi:hypothetical protein HDU96_010839 [Phlyctochytrium bullatum]|nr:hypothetical protein HDU96_010839 [Phlyctochytrium bullatum]
MSSSTSRRRRPATNTPRTVTFSLPDLRTSTSTTPTTLDDLRVLVPEALGDLPLWHVQAADVESLLAVFEETWAQIRGAMERVEREGLAKEGDDEGGGGGRVKAKRRRTRRVVESDEEEEMEDKLGAKRKRTKGW